MNVTILSIGDEVLIGQIVNSNAAWIGAELTVLGVDVSRHVVAGDKKQEIQSSLANALDSSDLVIVTGGLGPTHDDLTVEAIADHLGLKLGLDEEWLTKMQGYFQSRGREMPSNNERQAYRPEGSQRIDNDCGTAPGLWIETSVGTKARKIVVLPGVPYEMKSMMSRVVLPRLAEGIRASGGNRVFQKTLLTTGIGESALAEKIGDLSGFLNDRVNLAYLPDPLRVRLRMMAWAPTLEAAKQEVARFEAHLRLKIGKYLYGENDEIFEEVLGRILKEKGLTIAVAESATGGLILNRLTDVPGSSIYVRGGVVSYAEDVKTSMLEVDPGVIASDGAVSESVAIAMAEGVRKRLDADIGLSVTGNAGPTGDPVGLFWIGLSDARGSDARKYIFERDRIRNKQRAAQAALERVRARLLNG